MLKTTPGTYWSYQGTIVKTLEANGYLIRVEFVEEDTQGLVSPNDLSRVTHKVVVNEDQEYLFFCPHIDTDTVRAYAESRLYQSDFTQTPYTVMALHEGKWKFTIWD